MKIFTANIKDNPDMPDAQVRHDIRAIRKWKFGWSFGLFQEIGELADHRAVRTYFGKPFVEVFRGHSTPIVYNSRFWRVLDSAYHQTHPGRAGVTPNRGFCVLKVQHKVFKSRKLAIINTHLISGAWYGNHSIQQWRREMWNLHHQMLAEEIATLNAAGYTVIVGGDWNRHNGDIPRFTADQITLATHYYDHIYAVPAKSGTKITKHTADRYGAFLNTDHDPMAATVALK